MTKPRLIDALIYLAAFAVVGLVCLGEAQGRPFRRCIPRGQSGQKADTPQPPKCDIPPKNGCCDADNADTCQLSACRCGPECACDPCDCCKCLVCRCNEAELSEVSGELLKQVGQNMHLEQRNAKLTKELTDALDSDRDYRERFRETEILYNAAAWWGTFWGGVYVISVIVAFVVVVSRTIVSKPPRLGSWVLLVALLFCGNAQAQSPVASVGQSLGGGRSASGVGTLVGIDGTNGIVVTCAHIFENGSAGCWVEWSDGRHVNAQLLGVDRKFDIAALRAPNPSAKPVPLATAEECPGPGDMVEFIGHGGGRWKHITPKVIGYKEKSEVPGVATQLASDFQPIPGDSGGPLVFNGKLVAVNWGGPGNGRCEESHGTYSGRIAECLTQWGCPQGGCRPAQPIYQPPAPVVQQPPAPTPPKVDHIKPLHDRIEKLEALIVSIKAERGAQGERGIQGPQGAAGEPGKDAALDLDELVEAVQAKLPPIRFQVYDGKELLPGTQGTRDVRLGETLPLQRYLIQSKSGTASPGQK